MSFNQTKTTLDFRACVHFNACVRDNSMCSVCKYGLKPLDMYGYFTCSTFPICDFELWTPDDLPYQDK